MVKANVTLNYTSPTLCFSSEQGVFPFQRGLEGSGTERQHCSTEGIRFTGAAAHDNSQKMPLFTESSGGSTHQ